MLTIKSPIKLRCNSPMETVHRDFSEKIIGNYTIMNSRLRKEELLYITTQAPEVYFAEGNSISILNDVNIASNQEIKLDMINNLINRILVSGTNNFSYQDSVYISNVLRKIGITDVNNFMKNVHRLQEEKKENNKLINVYEEQKNLLMSVFEQAQSDKTSQGVKNETNNEYQNRYYIHEEIYNRLDTANLYQEMHQFSQGIETDARRIYNAEVAISEQVSMVRNFNLHNLKKEIFNSNQPINYYHANMYELADNEELPVQTAHEKITSAILLNLVDDIYSLRINQIEKNNHNWYTLASTLFQSADNTWKRYETYHNENRQIRSDMYNTMTQLVDNKRQENNIINNIIREMVSINPGDEITEYGITENTIQNINNTDNYSSNVQRNNYENIHTDNIMHQSEYNRREDIRKINESHYDENVNLNYLEEINNIVNENTESEHVTEFTRQKLDEINRRNIENYKKIQEIQTNRPHITNVEINKEKARQDMLRSINNPQEVIMEYLQSQTDNTFEEINNRLESEVFNLFTDETKEIFNQYLMQKNGQSRNINNINTNIHNEYDVSENYETSVNMEHREQIVNVSDMDEGADEAVQPQSQNIHAEQNIHNTDVSEYITNSEKRLYEQFFLNTEKTAGEDITRTADGNTHIHNDINNLMHQNSTVIMEHVNVGDNESESAIAPVNVIQSQSTIKYELNEIVQKNIMELRNYSENRLYNNFTMGEAEIGLQQTYGRNDGKAISPKSESAQLQHFIMDTQNKEYVIQNTLNERTITTSKVGLVHKVEEQIITEDLINTIKERTVDNRREETIEHSTHNIVKKEKNIQETVNSVLINKQNNIEELVQQNVQKQLNRISDQVYGKIEKKLQTERKRRGF